MATPQNNGSQGFSPYGAQSESIDFKIPKICLYFIILSASTFGNSMVAHIICSSSKMRTASNFLILNLALCDLVTPVISIIFDFVLEEYGYYWPYGGVMCKVLWPASTYFTTASSLTLAVIALDRYKIIMHPFITRLSSKQTYALIFSVHALSLVAVTPYGYFLGLNELGYCKEHWPKFQYRQSYTIVLFLIQYGLPLTFMVVMYTLALRALYNTSARLRGSSIMECKPPSPKPAREKTPKSEDQEKAKISANSFKHFKILTRKGIWETANGRAMKMFIIVVTVFAICMFPNQVVWLWADFGGGIENPNYAQISIVCWLFTYANSVVNPIIFGVFSKDFHKGFKKIFEKLLFCQRLAGKHQARERTQSVKTATETLEGEINNEKPPSERKTAIGNLFLPLNTLIVDIKSLHDLVNQNSTSLKQPLKDEMPEGNSGLLIDYFTTPTVRKEESDVMNFLTEYMESALMKSPETNC